MRTKHLLICYSFGTAATLIKTLAWWLNQWPSIRNWSFAGRWAVSAATAGLEYAPLTLAMSSASAHKIHLGLLTAYMVCVDNFLRMMQQLGLHIALAYYDWIAALILALCVIYEAYHHYLDDKEGPSHLEMINSNPSSKGRQKEHSETRNSLSSTNNNPSLSPHLTISNKDNSDILTIAEHPHFEESEGDDTIAPPVVTIHGNAELSLNNNSSNFSNHSSSKTRESESKIPGAKIGTSDMENKDVSGEIEDITSACTPSTTTTGENTWHKTPLRYRVCGLSTVVVLVLLAALLAALAGPTGQAYVLASAATSAKTFAWWINQYPILKQASFSKKWLAGWSIAAVIEYIPLIGAFSVAGEHNIHLGLMTAYMIALDNVFRVVQQQILGKPQSKADYKAAAGMVVGVIYQGLSEYFLGR